jgi:hypothetical protein
MSKPIERVDITTDRERRRRYTTEEKLRLVAQTMQPGMTIPPSHGFMVSHRACWSIGGGAWLRGSAPPQRRERHPYEPGWLTGPSAHSEHSANSGMAIPT